MNNLISKALSSLQNEILVTGRIRDGICRACPINSPEKDKTGRCPDDPRRTLSGADYDAMIFERKFGLTINRQYTIKELAEAFIKRGT